MDSARRLYRRFRQLIHEGAKFGIVGIAGVFLYNILNSWLHIGLGIGPITSATISFIVTAALNYLANRYWSFRDRERTAVRRESVMFLIFNGLAYLIQVGILGFITYGMDMRSHLANFVANNLGIAAGTLFRFWSYRKWVWGERPPMPQGHEEIEPVMATVAAPASQPGAGQGPASEPDRSSGDPRQAGKRR